MAAPPLQLHTPASIGPASGPGDIKSRPAWSPYDDNGGTCVAVAGSDYCIVAASTRLSTGFSILTRDCSKLFQISEQVYIASAGFQADIRALQKMLQTRNVMYQHIHRKPMSASALAQLLGNNLYYKRFFPYFTWNLCVGLDPEGKGSVYTYDPVGSFERVGYSCQGSGKDLIQPVLDNQLKAASPLVLPSENWMTALPLEQAQDLVRDAFVSAGERDIYTGDCVEILTITTGGVHRETLDLKKD
ncbi:hypothetical protein WJX74_006639 [Apatococcus lobatus]|uniref:Proteasome subunit beta n=1 Tax=Apatococcus lobatus TaxID=904363 RepID=A0AAW1QAZ8_9CHLO